MITSLIEVFYFHHLRRGKSVKRSSRKAVLGLCELLKLARAPPVFQRIARLALKLFLFTKHSESTFQGNIMVQVIHLLPAANLPVIIIVGSIFQVSMIKW